MKSNNSKTGPIPVSTTTAKTCPKACPFNNANEGGCYANGGPLAMHWKAVTEEKRGMGWDDFCTTVATMPAGTLWRHNQAGDLPGDTVNLDRVAAIKLANANTGRKGFTFTHYDTLENSDNRLVVEQLNLMGFTVNLSANNPEHADKLAALEVAPVATVLPSEYGRGTGRKGDWTETPEAYGARIAAMGAPVTPEGRRIVICPATYRDDKNCSNCGLCQKSKGRAIVGFPAHGASKRKADAIAMS